MNAQVKHICAVTSGVACAGGVVQADSNANAGDALTCLGRCTYSVLLWSCLAGEVGAAGALQLPCSAHSN